MMTSKISFTPKPYQGEAIQWIEQHPRCCLFLEMGLGKTVSTLTAIQHLVDDCEVERVLVVAPKKVADSTWQSEADKWQHLSLRVVGITGTPQQRTSAMHSEGDVYIIGRDSLAWLTDQRDAPTFDMVVFDELTSFKNHQSTRTKAALRLSRKASRVVGLTGTPTPQGLIDLFAQMLVIDLGERLGTSLIRYRNTYFDYYERNHIILNLHPKRDMERVLRALLSDICLTMLSEKHNPLPKIHVRDVSVTLSEERWREYKAFERDRIMEMEGEDVTAASAAALMNKLMQMTGGAAYDEEHGVHVVGDEKMSALKDEIAKGTPLLVFYQYQHERDRILAEVKGARQYKSADDLRAWNRGEIDVMVCHPASTAYGLNLQYGGHRMVWYSPTWNLELYEQAVARLHRQGQKHEVECVRLVCHGTVDDAVIAALGRKGKGQRALMTALAEVRRQVVADGE